MRLDFIIDNMSFTIDTRNPKLLGEWITEILERFPEGFTPATRMMFQIYPSFYYNPKSQQMQSDWFNDSRVLMSYIPIENPERWRQALIKFIEDVEK